MTVQGPVKEQQPDGMSHRGAPWVLWQRDGGVLRVQHKGNRNLCRTPRWQCLRTTTTSCLSADVLMCTPGAVRSPQAERRAGKGRSKGGRVPLSEKCPGRWPQGPKSRRWKGSVHRRHGMSAWARLASGEGHGAPLCGPHIDASADNRNPVGMGRVDVGGRLCETRDPFCRFAICTLAASRT